MICQYDGKFSKEKYMPVFGSPNRDRHRARFPKKSKAQKNCKYATWSTLDFPENALGDGPAFWIFQDSWFMDIYAFCPALTFCLTQTVTRGNDRK